VTEEAAVVRNVVVHECMGDPAGYAITYDDERLHLVIRIADGVHVGRFPSRSEAIAAAEADRQRPDA
jgi:hypothetical protein